MANLTNINNKFLVTTGGNVGINTTSPGAKLQIGSATNAPNGNLTNNLLQIKSPSGFAYLTIGNGDTANATSYIGGASGFIVLGSVTDAGATSEHIRMTNTGNVGIGTASPSDYNSYGDNLVVADSAHAGISIASGTTSLGTLMFADGTGGTAGYRGRVQYDHNTDSMNFHTAAAERMRIRSSGTVGIGSDGFDSQMLTIAAGTLDGAIYATSTDANCFASFRDNSSTANIEYGAIGNAHVFRKDASEYMRIDGNGNVGIGTDSPASKFEVYGGNSGVNDVDRYIRFKASNGEKRFDFYVGGTGNASSLGMYTSDGTTKNVQISGGGTSYFNSGNVGIGTTSPGSKLEVKTSGANTTVELDNSDTNYTLIQYNAQGATKGFSGFNAGFMLFGGESGTTTRLQSGGSYAATILENGNFGIGTTSPSVALDVTGEISASDDINTTGKFFAFAAGAELRLKSNSDTGESYINFADPSDNNVGQIFYGHSDNRMIFRVNDDERMRITSAGNLGIGTSTFAPTITDQIKLGNMGSGVVGEIFDANVVDGAARMILAAGGSTGQVPIISLRHYSAAYGLDIWMYYSSPWNTYVDNRNANSGFIFRNNCNAVGGENAVFEIGGTGRINMYGLDAKGTTGSDVRYNTSTKELYYLTSSKRYKNNIVNLESSLDKINALRPVRFKDIKTGEDACGLIAEETFEIIPDVVFTKEIEGFDEPQIEGLNYSDLVPFLIKSIQELKAEIDELKK